MSETNELKAEIERLRDACTDFENAYVGEHEDRLAAEAALTSERAAHAGLRARLKALAEEWADVFDDASDRGEVTPIHAALLGAAQAIDEALAAEPAAPVAAEEGGER